MSNWFPLLSLWKGSGAKNRTYSPKKPGPAPEIVRPKFTPAPPAAIRPQAPRAVAVQVSGESRGEVKLIGVDEPTAAMIMAIVCDETKLSLGDLAFQSIRLLEA